MKNSIRGFAGLAGVFGCGLSVVHADDAYYHIALTNLKITEGTLPREDNATRYEWHPEIQPYAVIDGAGEAYVVADAERRQRGGFSGDASSEHSVLVVRADAGKPLSGTVFVPKSDFSGVVALRFTIPADAATPDSRRAFYEGKLQHYEDLRFSNIPGTAWFRRQADEARRQLPEDANTRPARNDWRAERDLSSTYELFVGGEALSENLQLTRGLRPRGNEEKQQPAPENPVAVSSIDGITAQAMDWTALNGDAKPELDPLAAAIPADQHAVFFNSFDALLSLADETGDRGLPVFRTMEGRSEDGRIIDRYEKQLGIRPGALTRLLGPKVVKSVAITGSDPYFPMGTDVAVLFQASDAKTLGELILSQVRAQCVQAGAKETSGDEGGVHFTALSTPDRTVCSHVAVIGDAVVVTNSLVQLRRLSAVKSGEASIVSLPEYKYFRTRYPFGAPGETGLVFLSDATLRRWCGPEWRIGDSRRVRARAIMADTTAAHMADLVKGLKDTIKVDPETPMRTIGEVTLGPGGVRSSVYGTTAFQSPIAELGIKEVAPDEADAYRRWRDGYQQNWRWAFDPIAISFSVSPTSLGADATIMPLIAATEYRSFIEFGKGASIGPRAGDPHDATAHAVFAVNIESNGIRQVSAMAHSMALGSLENPLGWLGKSIAIYADPDPFWMDLAAAKDPEKFFETNAHRLPIAINAEVGSALKLTAFLAGVRAFIDQTSPGTLAWTTAKHNDHEYVKVELSEKGKGQAGGEGFDKLSVCYAMLPDALVVSTSEAVLDRAIDRSDARKVADAKPDASARPWLGASVCGQFSRAGMNVLNHGLVGSSGVMQHAAWSNIPILNEWKTRFPSEDPVKLHEARWHVRLIDPAGGTYVWNDEFKTMESTTYGSPGKPKAGPEGAGGMGPLNAVSFVNAGLTFENQGLRAKAVLERKPAAP